MPGKQAKIITADQLEDLLFFASNTRLPLRNRVIVLLSMRAGLRSVRFARYSAQELAAASESLLFGTVGDIDYGSRANGLRAGGVEQVSRSLVSYHKSSASL